MFQNVPECSRMFQNVPECSWMFQNIPKWSKMIQNVPVCSIMLTVGKSKPWDCLSFVLCPMLNSALHASSKTRNGVPWPCITVPWTCIQLHELACSYISLHADPWTWMQFHGHASPHQVENLRLSKILECSKRLPKETEGYPSKVSQNVFTIYN